MVSHYFLYGGSQGQQSSEMHDDMTWHGTRHWTAKDLTD